MKMLFGIAICFVVLGLILMGCNKQQLERASTGNSPDSFEKVSHNVGDSITAPRRTLDNDATGVVIAFWRASREYGSAAAGDFVSEVPDSFANSTRRCERSAEEEAGNRGRESAELDAVVPSEEKDWRFNRIVTLAKLIGDTKLEYLSVEHDSSYENESVVAVKYRHPEIDGMVASQYFFLYRSQDTWRIFMIVEDPLFLNPSYAGQNCRSIY